MTAKPLLLDLFCGEGGAGMGYHRAGFRVVGVDIKPQPRYPFQFIQMDALSFLLQYGKQFDVIHASPPCQFASAMHNPRKPELRKRHKNLIPQTRWILQQVGKFYIIENVKTAAPWLTNPLMLHGSMFDLPIFRERLFESNPVIWFAPAVPRTDYHPIAIVGKSKGQPQGRKFALADEMRAAMDTPWMSKMGARQAIPPAYTEFIGRQLLKAI